MATVVELKKKLRGEMRSMLRELSEEYRLDCGKKIAHHIAFALKDEMLARELKVALFSNFQDEICTKPIFTLFDEYHAEIALPIVDSTDAAGFFSKTTLAINNLDYIFVPGLAFTLKGWRLGRGKGYYDKMLAKIVEAKNRPHLIGLAMDEQLLSQIPIQDHDIAMDFICTPSLGLIKTEERD